MIDGCIKRLLRKKPESHIQENLSIMLPDIPFTTVANSVGYAVLAVYFLSAVTICGQLIQALFFFVNI